MPSVPKLRKQRFHHDLTMPYRCMILTRERLELGTNGHFRARFVQLYFYSLLDLWKYFVPAGDLHFLSAVAL